MTAPAEPPAPWGRRILLGVLAGAALYLALAVAADAEALGRVLARLDGGWVAVALLFLVTSLVVRSVRWSLYRHKLGVWTPFPVNVLLGVPQGRLGLVVKAQHLRERAVRYGLAIPAVVAERTTEILALGLLTAALAPLAPRGFAPPLLGGAAIAALYALLVRHPPLVEPMLKRLEGWSLLAERAHDLRLALAELPALLGGRLLAGSLALSLVGLLLEACVGWALAVGLGLGLGVGVLLVAYFAGAIAGLVSMLPGGILAAEGGMIAVLLAAGLALPEATALTLATRAGTLWLNVGLGVVAAFLARR